MSDLPKTVNRADVFAALTGLLPGFDPMYVFAVNIGVRFVEVHSYRVNDAGRKYAVDGEPATAMVRIAMTDE